MKPLLFFFVLLCLHDISEIYTLIAYSEIVHNVHKEKIYFIKTFYNVDYFLVIFSKYSNVQPFSSIASNGVHSPVGSRTRIPFLVP